VSEKKPWYEDIKDKMEKLDERSRKVIKEVAYLKGKVDEMTRHNQRTIKILAATITGLIAVIGALLGVVVSLCP